MSAEQDPLSFFAAEHEQKQAAESRANNGKAILRGSQQRGSMLSDSLSLFSDMISEARDALSPLGKEMKSAAASAADYLLQSNNTSTSPGDSSEVCATGDLSPRGGGGAPMVDEYDVVSCDLSVTGGGECAPSSPSSPNSTNPLADEIPLLTGEQKLMSLKDAYIQISLGRMLPGTLFMTNYRVSFIPSPTHLATLASTNPSVYSWLHVPLSSIDRVDKERRNAKDARGSGITLVITCKDVRQHRITTNGGEYELDRAFSTMSAYAFPNKMGLLFAFSHSLTSPVPLAHAEPYDPIQEFSRQGIIDVVVPGAPQESMWRISMANKDFKLCKTYPQYMVMPRGISDEELFLVSNFRSGHRLPTLSWGDKENGATLWRSSQPKAGVSGSCLQDEKFLELLAQSCVIKKDPLGNRKIVGEPILHVVDCRPRASAMANRATGAGYESQTNYPYIRLEFYNIGNIHVMRDSLKGIMNLVLGPSPPSGDIHFSRLVEDSQWLQHLRYILKASWDSASFLRKGMPVLVHCSHGWDRTAQVCSLAQIFLDPFYRTIDGFQVLVEKEWCSFGHPFELRCAHAQPRASRQEDQMAPVFMQFLDCVWQILHQSPHFFEFNSRFLITLADHIYSSRFSTFLFSCDYDRLSNGAAKCTDVWTYMKCSRAVFLNPLFMNPAADNTITTHVLLPPLGQLLRNVTLWTDYFFRWSTTPTIAPPAQLADVLYQGGVCLPPPTAGKCVDLDIPAVVTEDDFFESRLRLLLRVDPTPLPPLSSPTRTSPSTVSQTLTPSDSLEKGSASISGDFIV